MTCSHSLQGTYQKEHTLLTVIYTPPGSTAIACQSCSTLVVFSIKWTGNHKVRSLIHQKPKLELNAHYLNCGVITSITSSWPELKNRQERWFYWIKFNLFGYLWCLDDHGITRQPDLSISCLIYNEVLCVSALTIVWMCRWHTLSLATLPVLI